MARTDGIKDFSGVVKGFFGFAAVWFEDVTSPLADIIIRKFMWNIELEILVVWNVCLKCFSANHFVEF